MDIYDKQRNKIGIKVDRGTRLLDGQFQLAACAVIVTNEKKLIVTQRHPVKQMGGYWEFPGGAVEEGELSSDAAIRELNEEIGLNINKKEMKFIQTYCYEPFHLLVDVYLAFRNIDKKALTLQESEVSDVDTWLIADIEKHFQNDYFTPYDFEISKIIKKYICDVE